jgi:hypothetical protein
MNPKEYADSDGEPQTPEEVDEVSEDDAASIQNHEQADDGEGMEAKLTTMDERKVKIQQLRAKMVRRLPPTNHDWLLNACSSGRPHSRIVPL